MKEMHDGPRDGLWDRENLVMVCGIERDAQKALTTDQRCALAEFLLGDKRVVGAWLALENAELEKWRRLQRLQVALAVNSREEGGDLLSPMLLAFGRRHHVRLDWSFSGNSKPDFYPKPIRERLRLPYTWNTYVTLGHVFKMPPPARPTRGAL